MRPKNWFKPKAFTHLTKKLTQADGRWIRNYVSNSDNIKAHSFYPLIHRTITTKRFKISKGKDGQLVKKHHTFDNGIRSSNVKYREIYYPNHLDAHVYSYYTQKILEPKYEKILKKIPRLEQAILAYRRIPTADGSRGKCNIDFANDVFDEIKQMKGEIAVLALDISKFFDSLDHKILKQAWVRLIAEQDKKTGNIRKDLPKDHYNIYKSLIEFAYVELNDMLIEFGYKHPNELIQEEVSFFVRDGLEFRSRVKSKGYLKKNPFRRREIDQNGNEIKIPKGIPQGTPISAFLANLYLLEFDKMVLSFLEKYNGIYRRYSDDILIICSKDEHKVVELFIYELIKNFKLEIQPSKTQRSFFSNGRLIKGQKPVSYLGFQFDGNRKFLKSASIAKLYRKMKSSVKFRAYKAHLVKKNTKKRKLADSTIHRRHLYKQFSYLGASKGGSRKRNFFSYANSAAKIMGSPSILKQLSKAWKILHIEIKRQENNYRLPKINKKRDNNKKISA